MRTNELRRGLHIDDDDPPPKYEKQSLDADRKRGKFESDLDSMLFGGGPAPRRRPQVTEPADKKQGKPAEPVKPPTQPASNTQKPVVPQVVQPPKTDAKNQLNTSGGSGNATGGLPPSYPSSQGQNLGKSGQKKPGFTNQTSVIVPGGDSQIPTIKSLQIETKAQINNYVDPKKNDVKPPLKPQVKPEVRPDINQDIKIDNKKYVNDPKGYDKNRLQKTVGQREQKKEPSAPVQPKKHEQPTFVEVVHVVPGKNSYNKPGYLRKLKKIAEDFKFAEENVSLHYAVDVIRPGETNRNKILKLNDLDFKDFEFPAASISLGLSLKGQKSTWKRPNELARTVTFGKYIDPNDLKAGNLSSPHFVSTLSVLAEFEANYKRLIEDQKANTNGFYFVRVFVNSVWRYVPVDSLLPFVGEENAGVISHPDAEFELSSALIEKAYAKSFGGYDVFSRVQPREHYLRDLTGAPVKRYSLDNPELGAAIKKAIASGYVILAIPSEKITALGVNPNYSLSVINYNNKGGLELRNSWGTLEERSKASFSKEGVFELGPNQARENISHILIGQVNTAYSTTTIQSKHKFGFYSSYSFKVRGDAQGFLSVSQWDERLFPIGAGYEYSPLRIIIEKINSDKTSTYINAGYTSGVRNLDIEVNLTPGKYLVFVAAQWKSKEQNYNLTFYGTERVDFERVYTEKIPNLITSGLEAVNLAQGNRTDVGKNGQYVLYHQDSNLLLVTVENISDNSTNITQDFSRVKFDHLVLLNSRDNQENYANRVSSEVEEYKAYPLEDRRWTVSLGAHERFTWVLSTDLDYEASNIQAWGFK